MNLKEVMKSNCGMARMLTTEYTSDLTQAEWLTRPVPAMNHITWQLGHLISSEHRFVSGCGFPMPALPADFAERYTKETATSDDLAKFHSKEQLLKLYDEVRKGTLAAIERATDADMDKPGPEGVRDFAPTVGSVFLLAGQHEMMHAGQFVAVRRKLGRPVKF